MSVTGCTIDCANPINWGCHLNRGCIGDYSYIPGLSQEIGLGNSAPSIIHDLTKLPGGLHRGYSGTSIPGVHGVSLGPRWRHLTLTTKSRRPGSFGTSMRTSGGGGSDAVFLGGTGLANASRYMFLRSTPFAVFMWIYLDNVTQNHDLIYQVWDNTLGVSGWGFDVDQSTGPALLRLRMLNSTATAGHNVTGTTGLSSGIWYYVGFSYNGSNTSAGINLFVDGVLETTTNNLDSDPGEFGNYNPTIGGGSSTGRELLGAWDQCRWYNRVISGREALELHTEVYTGSPSLYNRVTLFHFIDPIPQITILPSVQTVDLTAFTANTFIDVSPNVTLQEVNLTAWTPAEAFDINLGLQFVESPVDFLAVAQAATTIEPPLQLISEPARFPAETTVGTELVCPLQTLTTTGNIITFLAYPLVFTPHPTNVPGQSHFAEQSRSGSSVIVFGSEPGPFKLNPSAVCYRRNGRSHVLHLARVKPQIVENYALFDLLGPAVELSIKEFDYQAPGGYLEIWNDIVLLSTIQPDNGDWDTDNPQIVIDANVDQSVLGLFSATSFTPPRDLL